MRKNLRAGLFRYNNKKTPLRERRLVLAKAAQQNKDKDNSSPRCTTQPNPPPSRVRESNSELWSPDRARYIM